MLHNTDLELVVLGVELGCLVQEVTGFVYEILVLDYVVSEDGHFFFLRLFHFIAFGGGWVLTCNPATIK